VTRVITPSDGWGTTKIALLVVGVDISKRYVEYVQRQYKGTFHVMDARHIEYSDGSFDGVLVYGLLHHLNDDDA